MDHSDTRFSWRRVRDSKLTASVHLLAKIFAYSILSQKLFESRPPDTNNTPFGAFLYQVRRVRDSNPRGAINPYLVSSEALSTTQPTLRVFNCSHPLDSVTSIFLLKNLSTPSRAVALRLFKSCGSRFEALEGLLTPTSLAVRRFRSRVFFC
jgi:hypothetical protein